MSKLTDTQKDIKFLLSFAPATNPDDVVEGMFPTYYITGRYETDLELVERINDIITRHNIDLDEVYTI